MDDCINKIGLKFNNYYSEPRMHLILKVRYVYGDCNYLLLVLFACCTYSAFYMLRDEYDFVVKLIYFTAVHLQ